VTQSSDIPNLTRRRRRPRCIVLTVSLPRAEFERRAAEAHELLGERCVVWPGGGKAGRRANVDTPSGPLPPRG
jgi:hypothetical protein